MGTNVQRTPKSGGKSLFFQDLASPIATHRGKFSTPEQEAAVSALRRDNFGGSDPPPPPFFTLEDRVDFSPESGISDYHLSSDTKSSDIKPPLRDYYGSGRDYVTPLKSRFEATSSFSAQQQQTPQTSLLKDLEMLPFGDLTEIGERGVNLSGGQKQRIQLARAIYQDADIYLMDDPFSAVDAHTATNLFNEYVMGALSAKTVLLVTHQVDFLPKFDSILLMSDGKILRATPYLVLLASREEFSELVNAHKGTAGSESFAEVYSSQRTSSKQNFQTYSEKQLKSID